MTDYNPNNIGSFTFLGHVGYNWHGSFPTFVADAKFEPNFRQFNMIQDVSLPNEDLHNKLLTNHEGLPDFVSTASVNRFRGWPIMASSTCLGLACSYVWARMNGQRTIMNNPWLPVRMTIICAALGNFVRYSAREMTFTKDFERNQYFAYDEIKARRDEERVRKAIEAKNYTNDPLTEYRVKAWQVARTGL